MNKLMTAAVLSIAAAAARAETFGDALIYAYDNNPSIRAHAEELRATREAAAQMKAGWRPDIRLTGEYRRTSTGGHANGIGVPTGEATRPLSMAARLTQNVFAGFSTVYNTRAANYLIEAAEHALKSYDQALLSAAAGAYLEVRYAKAVLDLQVNQENVLKQNLTSARNRFKAGQITRTDVSQSEARLAQATAARVGAEGKLRSAEAAYVKIVGREPKDLSAVASLKDKMPESLSESIKQAEANSPELLAAVAQEKSAEAESSAAVGDLLPTVDAYAAAGRDYENDYDGDDEGHSATVGISASWKLYDSGVSLSKARQSRYTANRRRMESSDARRAAVQNATSAWTTLEAARAQITSIEAQISAANLAAEGVKREARAGARTTLDVMDAEQELLNARVSLAEARKNEVTASLELLAAVGKLTLTDLGFRK